MVISNVPRIEKAYAKLNLYLDVLRLRDDNYHDIIGLFQTINLCDLISFEKLPANEGIKVICDVPISGRNIVEKAFYVFCENIERVDFGLRVTIFKRIPIGAGLGGGSSDAAATLRYLAVETGHSFDEVFNIAHLVGSDVPFLIFGGTAVVTKKGESVHFLEPLQNYEVKLISPPGVRISTKEAYSKLTRSDFAKGPGTPYELYRAYRKRDFSAIRKLSYNVFQEKITDTYPAVAEALALMKRKKPIVHMMTGTGSTVFSVFDRKADYSFVTGFFRDL